MKQKYYSRTIACILGFIILLFMGWVLISCNNTNEHSNPAETASATDASMTASNSDAVALGQLPNSVSEEERTGEIEVVESSVEDEAAEESFENISTDIENVTSNASTEEEEITEKETEGEVTEVSETVKNTSSEEITVAEPEEVTTIVETTAAVHYTEVDETVYVINTSSLNVRSGAGTSYNKLDSLSYGESAHRTGIGDNGWSRIEYNGTIAYVSSKYVSTTKPAEETTTESSSGSTSSSSYPMTYSDSTMTITVTKEWYENAWCYIAHLEFTDYTRFKTACANGSYGGGYETTSHAAKRLGAILCVNGCYSAPSLNYIVVRNGVICNGASRNLYVPAVYSSYNGLLLNTWEVGGTEGIVGKNVQDLVSAGTVTDTFCFGPPILSGGEILDAASNSGRAQRTFIGTSGEPGDIWLVVSDGRYNDGKSAGLTMYQCASLLKSKGCAFGVPLDGGGSSTMYFNGKVLNAASGNERAVVDFVYAK